VATYGVLCGMRIADNHDLDWERFAGWVRAQVAPIFFLLPDTQACEDQFMMALAGVL
jgi:hypothetical protein